MAYKPNYQQQRGDRARTKDRKRDEKMQRREEQSAARRKEADGDTPASPDAAPAPSGPTEPGSE